MSRVAVSAFILIFSSMHGFLACGEKRQGPAYETIEAQSEQSHDVLTGSPRADGRSEAFADAGDIQLTLGLGGDGQPQFAPQQSESQLGLNLVESQTSLRLDLSGTASDGRDWRRTIILEWKETAVTLSAIPSGEIVIQGTVLLEGQPVLEARGQATIERGKKSELALIFSSI